MNTGMDLKKYLETVEKDVIERALQLSNNNAVSAANLLKMKTTTLISKMKKYNMARNVTGRPIGRTNG